jgi:succinoglycan biosynthesis protein ExoA
MFLETATTSGKRADAAVTAGTVSVVIPSFNSGRYIGSVLENLAGQYDPSCFEIIVVDGGSTDDTRQKVEDFVRGHGREVRARLLENSAGTIPAGLNAGIAAARGEFVVRMDAHSVPSANYVRRCVELLAGDEAAVVGMPIRIRPGAETAAARAIALAVGHPFGIGDAKYRTAAGGGARFVDTVPFGAFRKSVWQEVGGFDEGLLTNEDYDFYYRVRQRGGRVLLDTAAHSEYFARGTFGALVSQYSRYGRWKAQMLKLHPRSARPRQMAAPAFVVGLLGLPLLGLWLRPALWLWLAMLATYAALSLLFAARVALKKGEGAARARLVPAVALAFLLVHVSWGCSFLLGLFKRPRA